jgi:restriction system protein
MWALRDTIQQGDLIVLPLKTTKNIALGWCSEGYRYLAGQPEDRTLDAVLTLSVDRQSARA